VRVFLDTNVLVSALTTRGLCADVLRVVLAEHDLTLGEVVLDELRRVLTERFRVPHQRVREAETYLRTFEVVARPTRPADVRVRDGSDRWVLASALAGRADALVTGDADLLTVGDWQTIRVLSPRAFWEELRRGSAG
jgi:putative PIN family toxin of toxin-antitoxin system